MQLGSRYNQHSFAQIPMVNLPRSKFNRSSTVKTTFDFDYLVPIFVDEVIPGDTWNLTAKTFARLATQIVPIMDNTYIDYFFFYVPNRLVYDKWEKLNGAQDNPGDSIDFICPQITAPAVTGFPVDTIYDHFGLPTGIANLVIKNTLPLRCYNKIYNDWFRSEDLQNKVIENVDQGPDAYADYTLLKRGKRHDYFTSALPWPQKGDAVELPLGTTAEVWGTGTALPTTLSLLNSPVISSFLDRSTTDGAAAGSWATVLTGGSTPGTLTGAGHHGTYAGSGTVSANGQVQFMDKAFSQANKPGATAPLMADLTNATAATINQLRQAMMVQSLLELDARGGTRYVEILRNHFGVISPDFRLQRSEYLGGGSVPIHINQVAQTAPTSGSNALGQLAAFGTQANTSSRIGFSKSFVEHGYIIGLACARADITYQQGLNRMWNRSTRYDFFWPKLQQLGEQAILGKEIYCDGTAADEDVWGYQERYSEYKYKPSEIHGRFRSTYSSPLDMWHLAEEFGTRPALNASFIVQNTPIERAIAIDTEPDLLFDAYFETYVARPMATTIAPATLGRF